MRPKVLWGTHRDSGRLLDDLDRLQEGRTPRGRVYSAFSAAEMEWVTEPPGGLNLGWARAVSSRA
jgi:hypothetical protein